MKESTRQLLDRFFQKDKRALARLMTLIENRHEDLLEVMSEVSKKAGQAQVIGVTGPPGAGKSTLVDKLVRDFRKTQKTVGVLAIDPSSPFSGGAVLGDRIRMQDHSADADVFIRSLGSRGAHGGLSRATQDFVCLLDAFGFDIVLVETVGVGQTELDIMAVANTTLVVLVPESGDTIQTMKAGLMEIADIFVVNKSDREGADKIFHELFALSHMYSTDWEVPVLKTVAVKGEGVAEILNQIAAHDTFRKSAQSQRLGTEAVFEHQCLEIVFSEIQESLLEVLRNAPPSNPYESAKTLLQKIKIDS